MGIPYNVRSMGDFVAHYSRRRFALLLLGSLAFVIIGLEMGGVLGTPAESRRYSPAMIFVVGWFSVVFFGCCGAVALKRLFEGNSLQLRIGSSGILYPEWSDEIIPWSEIVNVSTWTVKRQKGIVLHLRDPARFQRKNSIGFFAKLNRLSTGGDVSIVLVGANRSFEDAMSAIARFKT